jgi:Fe-S-cluster containining protein
LETDRMSAETNTHKAPPSFLPCFPCPHKSACCRWGTYLSQDEATALMDVWGPDYVYFHEDDGEWRTQVKDGRCMFMADGGCSIHKHKHYPRVCRIFPRRDGRDESLPEAHDAAICPEVAEDRSQ